MNIWLRELKPIQLLIYGYLGILIVGFILLCLPIFQNQATTTIDNFFIATSSLSTTGLSPVSIAEHYNIGGQIIILLLVQIGGLGYMSLGSFIVLMRRQKLPNLNSELIKYDFSLPEGFNINRFIHTTVHLAK
ncbi:MAG: hypothetical protein AB8G11_06795 [Saprospiraceae bacterium]